MSVSGSSRTGCGSGRDRESLARLRPGSPSPDTQGVISSMLECVAILAGLTHAMGPVVPTSGPFALLTQLCQDKLRHFFVVKLHACASCSPAWQCCSQV